MGGCSAINAMAFPRGQRDDYDRWDKLGGGNGGKDGWGWEGLFKYFLKVRFFVSPFHLVRQRVGDDIVKIMLITIDRRRDIENQLRNSWNNSGLNIIRNTGEVRIVQASGLLGRDFSGLLLVNYSPSMFQIQY